MVTLQEVDNESFISDVFLNIFRILNEEATEVDSLGGTVSLVDQNASEKDAQGKKYWIGAFPNNYLENSGEFPIGIIKTPDTSDVRRGFRISEEYYTFELQVYARRAEHVGLFISKAWNELKKHEDQLADVGLYSLTHGQTNSGMTMRGELKVHSMTMPVTIRRVRC